MGAKLARDGNDAIVLADRIACIAAKAGSYSANANNDVSLGTVGAKLARDGNDAAVLADRIAWIAAKAGSYSRDAVCYSGVSIIRRTLCTRSLIWNGLITMSMRSPRKSWRLTALSA